MREWVGLRDHIEYLLDQGKTSKDPEFKVLLGTYLRDRVIKIALEIKKEKELKLENDSRENSSK